jgi:hypothetical protein
MSELLKLSASVGGRCDLAMEDFGDFVKMAKFGVLIAR